MNINIVLYVLIVSAGIYGAIACWKYTKIKTVKDLFHLDILKTKDSSEDIKGATISLVAANLTLGTGMVYIAVLAQKQLIMALLAPLGVWVGYFLLSRVVSRLTFSTASENHNLLDVIRKGNGGKVFYFILSLVIVLTYLILIPFEIYVSSNLLASMVPEAQAVNMSEVFAYSLFFIIVTYSALGGLKGVVTTDKLQLFFIILMVIIILASAYYYSGNLEKHEYIKLFPNDGLDSVFTLALVAFVTAVSTQFYSILNLSMGTNFNSEKQSKIYRYTGNTLFWVLLIFVFTGLATNTVLGASNFASIDILLNNLSEASSGISTIAVFFIIFGMMAVLISSADSGIIAISQTAYDNICGMDSFSDEGGTKLLIARLFFIFSLNAVAAVPLVIIFSVQPNIVELLLSAISALTVAAPFIISAAINISENGNSLISKLWVSTLAILIIVSVWVISILSVMNEKSDIGNLAILAGVCLGLIFYIVDSKVSAIKSLRKEH